MLRHKGKTRTVMAQILILLMILTTIICMNPSNAFAASARNASFSSNIPRSMVGGQSYTVAITVKNTGTQTWTAADGFRLVAVGGSDPLATQTSFSLGAGDTIARNQTKTFVINMVAPLKNGSYRTDWQMYKGTTKFGPVYRKSVSVRLASRNSLVTAFSVPTEIVTGQYFTATITMRNIGSYKWTKSSKYQLLSVGGDDPFASVLSYPLTASETIKTGQSRTFSIPMIAPDLPFTDDPEYSETYTTSWQMSYGTKKFGAVFRATITVRYSQDQLLEYAQAWLEAAESTHYQDILDIAEDFVNKLKDGSVKTALLQRVQYEQYVIDSINDYIDLTAAARNAVVKAESTLVQLDVNTAQALVNQLRDGSLKATLQNRLNTVQSIINTNAANTVIAKINALPAVSALKLSDKPVVDAARKAFDSLTAAQKALVTNLQVLIDAENRIAELDADVNAAKAVDDMIEALPGVDALTLADRDNVEAAREAYDELTAAQKKLVTKLGKLEELEHRITYLEVDVKAQDFGVMDFSGVMGYSVGFKLEGVKASGVQSVVVKLFKGNTLLATNTSKDLLSKYPNADTLSAPFDVFGTFDYTTDGCWTYSGWKGAVGDIPTKAEITVFFKNGIDKTVINENLAGDTAIFTKGDVVAQDFAVMDLSGVKGYNVGFRLVDAKASDVKSVEVKLYKDTTLLATNTSKDLLSTYPNADTLSAPFDVFGSFDYAADGCWTYSGWNGTVGDIPTKAEITVTFKNTVVATVTNDNLAGDTAIFTKGDVVAQDFAVMNLSGVKGYNVGFQLVDAKASDVKSVEVKLYKDTTLLATNISKGLLTQYPDAAQLSAPFDVFGTFDYAADGCWEYSEWNGAVGDVPTKAEITVTFKNTVVAIVTNENLAGDTTIFTKGDVVAQDFAVMDLSGVKGYNVGFRLVDAKASDVKSVEVRLYKDTTLLATNISKGLLTQYPDAAQLSAPFDVFGTFDYAADGCWEYSEWNGAVGDIPTKAEITVTFKNTVVATDTNDNLAGDTAIFTKGDVVAQDFAVMNLSGVKGYNVGFRLVDAKASDVKSVEVKLYKDTTLLAANVSKGLLAQYPDAVQLSAPFDVYGTFDYTADGCWEYSGWEGAKTDVPNKAEITVTFNNGVEKTVVNENLAGNPSSIAPMQVTYDAPEFVVGEQTEFTITTMANGDQGKMVRAHFTLPAEALIEYYEVNDGKWYPLTSVYGPSTGFPLANATSRFRATFSKAGSYEVAVQFVEVSSNKVLVSEDVTATVLMSEAQEAALNVKNEAELKAALADEYVTQIRLTGSFALSNTAHISKAVSIDGNGFTITGPSVKGSDGGEGHGLNILANDVEISNLTVTGSARSDINFFDVTGGMLTNVTLSNAANAGLIVNGSEVTISGVTTTNNAWGGINVDKGPSASKTPKLTVTSVTTHTSPTNGITPAIWLDKGTMTAWVLAADMYTEVDKDGMHLYYDKAEYASLE